MAPVWLRVSDETVDPDLIKIAPIVYAAEPVLPRVDVSVLVEESDEVCEYRPK